MLEASEIKSNELPIISLESLESVEKVAAVLGWSPEVLESAKSPVDLAIKAVVIDLIF